MRFTKLTQSLQYLIAIFFSFATIFLGSACQQVEQAEAQPVAAAESREALPNANDANDYTLGTLNRSLQDLTNSLSQQSYRLGNQVQGLAEEELKKLIKFEYRVVDVPNSELANTIEATLTALGEERWNCFHIESLPKSTRIFCKRLPFSVLRAVPYLW